MKKEKYENFIIYKFEDITPSNIQISSKILLPKNLSENIYINIENLENKDIIPSMTLNIRNEEIFILDFSFNKNKDYFYPITILNNLFRLIKILELNNFNISIVKIDLENENINIYKNFINKKLLDQDCKYIIDFNIDKNFFYYIINKK